jgi:hypothetical protein
MVPYWGEMVKYVLQNDVSQANLAPTSPKLANYTFLVILELITTAPKPTVSSISFNSIP